MDTSNRQIALMGAKRTMTKSTGYKINKNLFTFLVNNLIEPTPAKIYDIRAICGKYQHISHINNDFEILTTPQPEATNDNQAPSEVAEQGD